MALPKELPPDCIVLTWGRLNIAVRGKPALATVVVVALSMLGAAYLHVIHSGWG
jgi:hypothetical protein